jgi:hypothetical protein
MHRQILGCDKDVDHINHQTLDNRRLNLRPATKSQNAANQAKRKGSSKYKGVSWYKNYRKWVAQIGAQNQRIRLGYFVSEEDAGRAYDSAAIALHGKFAHLNFPS